MPIDIVRRGIVAGSVAGVAFGAATAFVATPLIEHMEDLAHHGGEHAHDHGHAAAETTTAIASVGGGVLWGILLGAVFGAAYYLFEPALPGRGGIKAYVLAGAGFLTVSVVPWLALPPAGPGAEQSLDPRSRLALYAGLMAIGAIVATMSIVGYRRVRSRGRPTALVVGSVPIVAVVAAAALVDPTLVRSGDQPTELVAAFRGFVVLSQAGLWLVLAGTFDRLGRSRSATIGDSIEPTRMTDDGSTHP